MTDIEVELEKTPVTTTSKQWVDVLTLKFPDDGEPGVYSLGVGLLVSENADTRTLLRAPVKNGGVASGGGTLLSQVIIEEEEPTQELTEYDLSGGETLVLQYRLGWQSKATIEKAGLFITGPE
jgi:hypothetical protein